MKFLDFLHADSIELNLKAKTPEEAVRELAELLAKANRIQDKEGVVSAVMSRETTITTGIGEGVAVPHAKIESVSKPIMAIGVTEKGIDWQSVDNRPAHLIILIISPNKDAGTQLRLLASISRLIKKKGVAPILLNTDSPQDLLDFFNEMENRMIL